MLGHIRRRGNRWQASVEVPRRNRKRKRIYRTFGTERGARFWIAERHVAVETKTFVPPSACTVAEAFDKWAQTRRQHPSTRRVYDSYGIRIVTDLGSLPIQSISISLVEGFAAGLATAPRLDHRPGVLSDRTVDHVIRQLKAFFAWAMKNGHIPRDPAVDLPRVKEIFSREMTILTIDQTVDMLAAALGKPVEGALWLAVMAGLRRGEALGLSWADVDFDAGRIRVLRSFSVAPLGPRLNPTKTLSSRRTIKLADDTLIALARIRAGQEARLGSLPVVVCPSPTGDAWDPSRFSHAFKRFLADAHMRPMRFHDLRHTHASQLIAADVHMKAISVRLGHKNIRITMDLYGHLLPGVEEMAVTKLQNLYNSAAGRPAA